MRFLVSPRCHILGYFIFEFISFQYLLREQGAHTTSHLLRRAAWRCDDSGHHSGHPTVSAVTTRLRVMSLWHYQLQSLGFCTLVVKSRCSLHWQDGQKTSQTPSDREVVAKTAVRPCNCILLLKNCMFKNISFELSKYWPSKGTWAAQPVKHPPDDFSSGHYLRVVGWSPHRALSSVGRLLEVLSPPLRLHLLVLSLSKITINNKIK